MKKKVLSLLLTLICTLGFCCGAAACGSGEAEHAHTYESGWTRDDTSHWHKATCGHTGEVSEKAAHAYGTEWKRGESAHWQECEVCGERGNIAAHTYGTEWKRDESAHWQECEVCGGKGNIAVHVYGDDGLCDICNYKKPSEEPGSEITELNFSVVRDEDRNEIGYTVGVGDAKYEERIVIPAQFADLPVLSVGSNAHVEFIHNKVEKECSLADLDFGPMTVSCMQLFSFAYCTKLKEVVISDGIPAIGNEAFYFCLVLTSVTIPNSVTSIGSRAFALCEKLTAIDFNGTTDEWKAIEKGESWRDRTNIQEVKCTDGTLTGEDIG